MIVNIFYFQVTFLFASTLSLRVAFNGAAALRSWGVNCMQFGFLPAVKGYTKVWVITLPPNFAKPLVRRWHSFLPYVLLLRQT